jgi:hypothetical protein
VREGELAELRRGLAACPNGVVAVTYTRKDRVLADHVASP